MHKLRQLRCAVLLPSLFRPGLRTREHCFLNVLWGERQACNYIGVSSGLDQPPGWGSRAGSSPSILQPHPIVGEPRGDLATRGAGQFASVEPGVVSDLGQRVGRRAELHHLLVRRELRLGKDEPVEGRGEDVDAHRRNAESGLRRSSPGRRASNSYSLSDRYVFVIKPRSGPPLSLRTFWVSLQISVAPSPTRAIIRRRRSVVPGK